MTAPVSWPPPSLASFPATFRVPLQGHMTMRLSLSFSSLWPGANSPFDTLETHLTDISQAVTRSSRT